MDFHALDFERLVVHLRRHILEDALSRDGAKHLSSQDHLDLGTALAHYCFRGEYIVGFTSDQEEKMAKHLLTRVEASELPAPAEIAAIACYHSLHKLRNADAIEAAYTSHPSLGSVISVQISEWKILCKAAKRIESATPISEGVSRDVQAQYEESPYPRWNKFPVAALISSWKAGYEEFPFLKDVFSGDNVTVLSAGCGTGKEPIGFALCEPQSKILAVDLSRASLAYAESRARQSGVHNINFMHGDILNLGTMGRTFDIITSSGVLHHMENPLEGWRSLVNILNPRGVMRVAFYSKRARRTVLVAREAARKHGYTPVPESMRAFRRDCMRNLDREAIRNLSSFTDYYVLSMYRDLLFHTQETNYDLLTIAAMLEKLGLEFSGFCNQAQMRADFMRMFPFARNMRDLGQWHAFEQTYPDTFAHMYQFWCRKKTA